MSLAYQRFSDPRAASRFLAEREEARLLGGGTLLVRRVNEGDVSIGTYVRLLAPELQQIEVGDDVVRLGAGVTMTRILRNSLRLARSIGPAVRAAATVGGNLFAPSPYGDFGVALLGARRPCGHRRSRRCTGTGSRKLASSNDRRRTALTAQRASARCVQMSQYRPSRMQFLTPSACVSTACRCFPRRSCARFRPEEHKQRPS